MASKKPISKSPIDTENLQNHEFHLKTSTIELNKPNKSEQ